MSAQATGSFRTLVSGWRRTGFEALASLRGSFIRSGHAKLSLFACLIMAITASFLILHIYHAGILGRNDVRYDEAFRVDRDKSYSEIFELACLIGATFFHVLIYKDTKQVIFLLIAGICALGAVDEYFAFHERAGAVLNVGSTLGELAVLAIAAALSALAFAAALLRTSRRHLPHAIAALLLIGCLAFFSIGVDFLHSILVRISWKLGEMFAFIEDGGELVAISATIVYAVSLRALCRAEHRPPSPTGTAAAHLS